MHSLSLSRHNSLRPAMPCGICNTQHACVNVAYTCDVVNHGSRRIRIAPEGIGLRSYATKKTTMLYLIGLCFTSSNLRQYEIWQKTSQHHSVKGVGSDVLRGRSVSCGFSICCSKGRLLFEALLCGGAKMAVLLPSPGKETCATVMDKSLHNTPDGASALARLRYRTICG